MSTLTHYYYYHLYTPQQSAAGPLNPSCQRDVRVRGMSLSPPFHLVTELHRFKTILSLSHSHYTRAPVTGDPAARNLRTHRPNTFAVYMRTSVSRTMALLQ
ncbi:hypothetical protein QTP88_017262 [Uroleucon formosanum]